MKDQRVLKLVQRLAASEEDGGKGGKEGGTQQSSDDWDELTAYVSSIPIVTLRTTHLHVHVYIHMTCKSFTTDHTTTHL